MNEYRRCEQCEHFVVTGMDGECHKRSPALPMAGSGRWPPVGFRESCGDFKENLDWFVAQLQDARRAVEELTLENGGLRADIEKLTEWHRQALAEASGRVPLPVVDTNLEASHDLG
jgi:hypothetical protein